MESDEPQQPDVGESAGQQLKRAREKHGLSVKDVADAQHLRVSIIQAIEDANYDQIASELFLKGYVRTYAKQVGADADALIRTLDVELEPLREERAKQEQENPLVDIERRRHKKRRLAKALLFILVFGAAAIAGWKLILEPRMNGESFVQGAGADVSADADTDGQEARTVENDADSSAGSPADIETELETNLAADLETDLETERQAVSGSDDAEPKPVVVGGESPAASTGGGSVDIASVDTQETEVLEPVETETVSPEPITQPAPVFEETAQPEAMAAQAQLDMTFVADCWVQIMDASGARLLASLQRGGEQISVSGRAPLKVVIGAVDAVGSVSFGGEAVDLADFRIVNNRTEFTLTP